MTEEAIRPELVEIVCAQMVRHDPNWQLWHWPTDEPRTVQYPSGLHGKTGPLWGDQLEALRSRARHILAAIAAWNRRAGGEREKRMRDALQDVLDDMTFNIAPSKSTLAKIEAALARAEGE